MRKLKFPSSKEMKKHIQENHGAHLLFNVVQSVRKPIENCTVKYQKYLKFIQLRIILWIS